MSDPAKTRSRVLLTWAITATVLAACHPFRPNAPMGADDRAFMSSVVELMRYQVQRDIDLKCAHE